MIDEQESVIEFPCRTLHENHAASDIVTRNPKQAMDLALIS